MIFFVDRFSLSIKAQDNSPRKLYSIDNSFPYYLGLNPIKIRGRLLENAVATTLYLISRHNTGFHFYYWNENNREVDFVIKYKQQYEAVQVAYSVGAEKTREREVTSLLDCCKRLNLGSGEIVTVDYSGEELLEGISIRYVSADQWIEEKLKEYDHSFSTS